MRVPYVLPALIFGLVCLWTNQGQAQTTTFNNGTGNGQWENAGNWTNGVPNASTGAVIPNGQTVTINGGTTVASLNNMGTIQGPNGTTASGGGVNISTSSGGITNSGTIMGGTGASTATLGGNGGSVQLTATRGQAITNSGTIRGGAGGNDTGGTNNAPGSGGSVTLRTAVDPVTKGGGVTNSPSGTIQGGNGGTLPPGGTPSVDRGTGGDVRFEGAGNEPSGAVTGDRSKIQGGKSSFPDRNGKVSQDGRAISLSGPGTVVEGGALAFSLNDLDAILNLSHLDPGAILATDFGIDIVTPTGGTVNLLGIR